MNITKGDWKVSGDSIVTYDYCIATVETDGGYEAPERNANKYLIAASPIGMELARRVTELIDAEEKVDVKLIKLANKFMAKLHEPQKQ